MNDETIKLRAERLLCSIKKRQLEKPKEEHLIEIERLEKLIAELNEEIDELICDIDWED